MEGYDVEYFLIWEIDCFSANEDYLKLKEA